ncbi:MAG TPA: hypothetical protein VF641_06440 [Methylobacterium sp.]
MKTTRRLALFATTALAALSVAPTQATDGTLPRDGTPTALAGADRWRLRPTEVTATGATTRRLGTARQVEESLEPRRAVRMVYPGLTATR